MYAIIENLNELEVLASKFNDDEAADLLSKSPHINCRDGYFSAIMFVGKSRTPVSVIAQSHEEAEHGFWTLKSFVSDLRRIR